MEYRVDFQESIQNAFLEYGASVAQERSIIDVRDGLKVGLRQGLYAQYTNKLVHKNKFQKAQKSVAAAMAQSYVHGDAACYSAFIRAAKPWSYRYPLEEAQGSYGTQCASDTESAARYVEMRSSELSDIFFDTLKKNSIKEWYNNYDDTEMIPSVFPSIGFWNVVNGATGIAVAMATSVPQFNLKEVNAALVKLINNPNISFNDIYCAPDFCGGGTILNANEVKDSLEKGTGKSIRMRAKLEYDAKTNCIIATELPYGVFTNTVIDQIAKAVDDNEDYGIDKVVDHTKLWADIRIYLSKDANPNLVINRLYKDTSLENWFSINMIMLDNGKFPRVFGWKEACQAYINHIRECKTRELNYDLDNLVARNHILEGLLIAIANIDEVIKLIKSSESAADAKQNLMDAYKLDEEQAKAILDIKLQRLAHLEAIKINNELEKNNVEIDRLRYILSSPLEINSLLIAALEEVANKFGDARRTKITNQLAADAVEEEEKEVMVRIYNGNVSLTTKRLSGKIIDTTNKDTLIAITNDGKIYHAKVSDIPETKNGVSCTSLFNVRGVAAVFSVAEFSKKTQMVFLTKNCYVKRSLLTDYNWSSKNGNKAIKLKDGDTVVDAALLVGNEENVGIMLNNDECILSLSRLPITGKLTFGSQLYKDKVAKKFKENK